jgi:hypothetical protein
MRSVKLPPPPRSVIEEAFREALSSGFSKDFYQLFVFYVGRKLSRDLFDTFLEDPNRVYNEIEEIYGYGVVFIFRALYDYIKAKIELNLSFDQFLHIVRSGDKDALRRIFVMLSEDKRSSNSPIPMEEGL